jgi:hypothetical protein
MQCILRIVANPKFQYHNTSGRARLDISDLSRTDHDLEFKGEPWASFGKPELKRVAFENDRVVVEAAHKIGNCSRPPSWSSVSGCRLRGGLR